VIPRLDTSLLDSVQAKPAAPNPQQQPVAPTGKNAFSAHLQRETTKVVDAKETKTNVTANRAAPAEGEKWRPVEGRDDYAEIISGDRKGQFVNLNRGGRKGEAFTIEEADGKTFHVYKRTGQDDLRVEVKADDAAKAAHTPKHAPSKGETWSPVSGTSSYADILSGSRNGYYVNISQGSSREGQAFHIVKSSGKTFHVYGDGDDAVKVEVGKTKKKDDDKKSESTTPTNTTNNTPNSTDSATSGGTTATTGKPVN
jgi:hypothetical protein